MPIEEPRNCLGPTLGGEAAGFDEIGVEAHTGLFELEAVAAQSHLRRLEVRGARNESDSPVTEVEEMAGDEPSAALVIRQNRRASVRVGSKDDHRTARRAEI